MLTAASISGATIKNLYIKDGYFGYEGGHHNGADVWGNAGFIAGNASNSTIDSVQVSDSQIQFHFTKSKSGFIIGSGSNVIIKNSVVSNCSSHSNRDVGGIIGSCSSSEIVDCNVDKLNQTIYFPKHAEKVVTSGGIVGYAGNSKIYGCDVTNSVFTFTGDPGKENDEYTDCDAYRGYVIGWLDGGEQYDNTEMGNSESSNTIALYQYSIFGYEYWDFLKTGGFKGDNGKVGNA